MLFNPCVFLVMKVGVSELCAAVLTEIFILVYESGLRFSLTDVTHVAIDAMHEELERICLWLLP